MIFDVEFSGLPDQFHVATAPFIVSKYVSRGGRVG